MQNHDLVGVSGAAAIERQICATKAVVVTTIEDERIIQNVELCLLSTIADNFVIACY